MTINVSLTSALLCVACIAAAPAMAQEPQEVRQSLMKEVGEATGVMGKMVKGETSYDAQAVLEALAVIEENSIEFIEYFPEGSETGFETEALPAIWENKDEFNGIARELSQDASEIIAAGPADLEAFRPMFMEMTENCGDCHDDYRLDDD